MKAPKECPTTDAVGQWSVRITEPNAVISQEDVLEYAMRDNGEGGNGEDWAPITIPMLPKVVFRDEQQGRERSFSPGELAVYALRPNNQASDLLRGVGAAIESVRPANAVDTREVLRSVNSYLYGPPLV